MANSFQILELLYRQPFFLGTDNENLKEIIETFGEMPKEMQTKFQTLFPEEGIDPCG